MRDNWLVLTMLLGCGTEQLAEREQLATSTTTTIVSLTFDDTLADQAQVGALLSARGMHATFYINSPRIDATGYMTSGQIASLRDSGNEIAGHTLDHLDPTTLSPDEMRRQICDDRVALLGRSYAVRSFAYPFGATNSTVEQVVRDCGYNSARGVGNLVSGLGCQGCPFAESTTPADPDHLKTPDSIKSSNTLADIQTYVTQAEQHGGGWVPLVIHHVCDGCDTNSVSAATLTAFLDWLAPRSAQGTMVRTISDVIAGTVQPASAFQNPSLELDADADLVPDCWQRGGFGTNTASFAFTTDAANGARAQRIDISAFTSGAARLVTKQDAGPCAPVVNPGHTYRVTGFYHATTPPRFTVYYRNTAGAWLYLGQSATLPVSTPYVAASYTTPAMPADATAISFGLSIYAVGSITMDAFAIEDTTFGDLTPPSAAVSAPAQGASVTGTVPIVAATSDNIGVVRVRFYLDGVQLGTRTIMPFRWNWGTTTTTPGSHVLAVQAEDAAGNATRSASITVTVL